MRLDVGRIRAVVRKELREYRHNRFILYSMVVLPLVFCIVPIIEIIHIGASTPDALVRREVDPIFLLLLIVPVVVPATIAAYSVIGEREQGTLEPFLTTPIRREEILLGKALAALVPSVTVSYGFFGVFLLAVDLGAQRNVVAAVMRAPEIVAQLLFTPLLATWSIWIGTAISGRSSDVRVAQQLGTLASLPALGVTSLISFQLVTPTVTFAAALAAGLLVVDLLAWRVVARTFDRERLISGSRRSGARPRSRRTSTDAPS